jgi:hypothetical protein
MIRTAFALTALALACAAPPAQAAIVNHADVGGFRTFQDTSTGLIWADLDNARLARALDMGSGFAYLSNLALLNALQATGFAWATSAEVEALLLTIPIGTHAEQLDAAGAMATDWGFLFGNTFNVGGLADAGSGLVTSHSMGLNAWTSFSPFSYNLSVSNGQSFWAYMGAAPGGGNVPEPASLALVGLALMAATSASRSKRQPAASA